MGTLAGQTFLPAFVCNFWELQSDWYNTCMKMIVGLGNPGEKYSKNRHNIGFVVVEYLAKMLQTADSSEHLPKITQGSELSFAFSRKFNAEMIQTKEYILAKPQTFMNDSGVAVAAIANFYKIDPIDIYVIHDDLDIALGSYKIAQGKGPKVHNGLSSVMEKIGTDQYINVRVGVENREVRGNGGIPGVVYSLQDFTSEEKIVVDKVIEDICKELSGALQGETS